MSENGDQPQPMNGTAPSSKVNYSSQMTKDTSLNG